MKWRGALLTGMVIGLGFAAWVERERLVGIASAASDWLDERTAGPASAALADLPEGELPGQPDGEGLSALPEFPDPVQSAPTPQSVDEVVAALRAAETTEEAHRFEVMLFNQMGLASSPTINALMEAGAQADAMEDFARAREVYADVVAIDPTFAEGWARAAASAFQMGDQVEAVMALRRALDLEPRHFAAWAGLATIYEEAGYIRQAEDAWREALYWNPMMDGARRGLARTRAKLHGVPM